MPLEKPRLSTKLLSLHLPVSQETSPDTTNLISLMKAGRDCSVPLLYIRPSEWWLHVPINLSDVARSPTN